MQNLPFKTKSSLIHMKIKKNSFTSSEKNPTMSVI